jgi:MoxR-like ATPase
MTQLALADFGPKSGDSLLAPLGLFGLGSREPAILGARIGGEPLLLIGAHGTGKSHMLLRLARAMGLEWRHYNASLLQFDDLVGFPLPDGKGGLDYIQTRSTIWNVQAAFFDEIARCRPELQNKLFPIIHEKRVQGLDLTRLVYRWAAMNPPESGEGDGPYRGSEPLDVALADRFAFIIEMPAWDHYDEQAQEQIIRARDAEIDPIAASRLTGRVRAGQSILPILEIDLAAPLACYVRLLAALLRRGSIAISPRRAGIILRNIIAVHAGRLLDNVNADLGESALLALHASLPQPAWGEQATALKVAAAHKEAWNGAKLSPDDPRRWLLTEICPVKRVMRGAKLTLATAEFSGVVADALAELPPGGRHALASGLFERKLAGKLAAAVAEQAAQLATLSAQPPKSLDMAALGQRQAVWQHVQTAVGQLAPGSPDSMRLTNLLAGMMAVGQLTTTAQVDRIVQSWSRCRQQIAEAA